MDKPGWLRSYETIHTRRIEREVPWCLEDASGVRVPVVDGRFARPLELDKLGESSSYSLIPYNLMMISITRFQSKDQVCIFLYLITYVSFTL